MIANLEQGALLTLAGMGLVFAVLVLLWGLITLLLRFDRGRTPKQPVQPPTPPAPVSKLADLEQGNAVVVERGQAGELSPEMLSAVMVAVRMHRRVRRKQAAPAMRTHQPGTLPSRWVGAGRVGQNQNWHPRHR
jgi:Na+-transporting methylmalonyl-CoA/oxaloacetate decarboxylase gamma subunit